MAIEVGSVQMRYSPLGSTGVIGLGGTGEEISIEVPSNPMCPAPAERGPPPGPVWPQSVTCAFVVPSGATAIQPQRPPSPKICEQAGGLAADPLQLSEKVTCNAAWLYPPACAGAVTVKIAAVAATATATDAINLKRFMEKEPLPSEIGRGVP